MTTWLIPFGILQYKSLLERSQIPVARRKRTLTFLHVNAQSYTTTGPREEKFSTDSAGMQIRAFHTRPARTCWITMVQNHIHRLIFQFKTRMWKTTFSNTTWCKMLNNVMQCPPTKICILNKMINATLLFLPPWAELKDLRLFLCTQKAYFCQILFTNLSKSVLVNEIIHPPHRCGILRCWLDSMIIAQVCLRLDHNYIRYAFMNKSDCNETTD